MYGVLVFTTSLPPRTGDIVLIEIAKYVYIRKLQGATCPQTR